MRKAAARNMVVKYSAGRSGASGATLGGPPGVLTRIGDDRDFGHAERSWNNRFEAERNRRKRLFHIHTEAFIGRCGVGLWPASHSDSFCAAPFLGQNPENV
jgi:hypothetical protein